MSANETSPFREIYRGTKDILAEFQASPFPNAKPLVKLENSDLTGALTKIHALGGHAGALEHNLEVLHRRRSAEFLLLLTGDKAVLSETMHVYREGTAAHNAFMDSANAKMLSIYVTDFQSDFIGDIHEVDASARRADILDNSIRPVAVEAETEDDERVTFTPEEWKSIGQEERDSFQSWSRRFAEDAHTKLLRHIQLQSEMDGERCRAVPADQFMAKLEQEFRVKAGHTQPEAESPEPAPIVFPDLEHPILAEIVPADFARQKGWNSVRVPFPITAEKLKHALSEIGVQDGQACHVYEYRTSVVMLDRYLPSTPNLDELNYLAAKIQAFTEVERNAFEHLVLDEKAGKMDALINLAENIKSFTFVPDPGQEFYHVDLGDHGELIPAGSVEETEKILEVYKGKEDIPSEFRVMASLCPEKKGSVLERIAAARAGHAMEPPKPIERTKHHTEPER